MTATDLPARPSRDRALETLALTPVALAALLAQAGAAEAGASGFGKASLDDRSASELSLEAALAQGRAQLAAGRVIEALQAYNQAVSQSPDSIVALNGVAVCYDRMGRFDTSRTFYETALGIDPRSPLLLNNYGYSLYLQGKRAEATRFLALALATGDADVQTTALRILAKIEAEDRKAPPRPDIAGPAVQQAIAAAPQAVAGQAQIFRTSAHEVRLVLADAPPPNAPLPNAHRPGAPARRHQPSAPPVVAPLPIAPAILAEALGPAAAAILPVAAFSAEEDQIIAQAEVAAIRRDAIAAAIQSQRQAQPLSAAHTAAVPALMQAMIDLALGARAVEAPAVPADYFAPSRPALPGAQDPEWNRNQLLVVASASKPRHTARTPPPYALAIAGIVPAHPAHRSAELTSLPAAEPITRKRVFEQPFASDDARLNGFANRLHGVEAPVLVDEQVARLEALMARMREA